MKVGVFRNKKKSSIIFLPAYPCSFDYYHLRGNCAEKLSETWADLIDAADILL